MKIFFPFFVPADGRLVGYFWLCGMVSGMRFTQAMFIVEGRNICYNQETVSNEPIL